MRSSTLRHTLGAPLTMVAALGAYLVSGPGCSGKGAYDGCPAINACGGNPVGSWTIAPGPDSVCVYVPPLTYSVPANSPPLSLVPSQSTIAQTPGKPAATPKSAGDWCYSLQYIPAPPAGSDAGFTMGGVVNANLPKTPGAVGDLTGDSPVTFVLDPSHVYDTAVDTIGFDNIHFAPDCLTAFGANPTCTELQQGLLYYYMAMPNYQQLTCTTASDGGCNCSYSYAGTAADTGTWQMSGSILYFLSEQNATQQVVATDFCVSDDGNSMVISGHDGTSMFATTGLRTLHLVRQ